MSADREAAPAGAGTGDPAAPLTAKLARLVELAADEVAVLHGFQTGGRRIPRSREIIAEGRKYDGLSILIEGVALRYRLLHDGRRQVLSIALPGDFIGFPGCFFENALYTVTALSECLVTSVPFPRLMSLFEKHPRLAAAIFWSFSCETATYAEHLIGVGRRSALERVAHFLLEMLVRLQTIGLADETSYRLPLTQELVADALGLSVQYVNHTLRQLRADDLVDIDGPRVTIKNLDGLIQLADFERTYLSRPRTVELRAENWPGAPA